LCLDLVAVPQDQAAVVSPADKIARGQRQNRAHRPAMPLVPAERTQGGSIPDQELAAEATTDELPAIRLEGEGGGAELMDSRQNLIRWVGRYQICTPA